LLCTPFGKEERKQLPLKHCVKNMIATNLSSALLNMETWIYQPPHVGYHGKLRANYSLDVIVSTKKFLLLKHTLDLLCTYLKEGSHLKCSFQHDNSLGFMDKHICKPISSIQSIKDVKVLLDLPSSQGILLVSPIAHMR